jgi:hypothetical protein
LLTIAADDGGIAIPVPPAFFTPHGGIAKGGATSWSLIALPIHRLPMRKR